MKLSRIYSIDVRKLIILLLPTRLRKTTTIQWLHSNLYEVSRVFKSFLKHRKTKLYELAHNSQLCYLQAVLNDAIDSTQRRVKIVNGEVFAGLYVYQDNESKPVYMNDVIYLYSNDDFIRGDVDFIVRIPLVLKPVKLKDLKDFEIYIKALTHKYKLACKTFKIEYR